MTDFDKKSINCSKGTLNDLRNVTQCTSLCIVSFKNRRDQNIELSAFQSS